MTLFAATLSWLLVFASASLLGCLFYQVFRRVAELTPVRHRSGLFLIYALLPAVVAIAVASTLYFPVIANLLLPEHCHGSDCSPHAPVFAVNVAYAATSTAAALVALVLLFYLPLRQLLRHRRNSQLFQRFASPIDDGRLDNHFSVVENDRVMAWCDGLLWPRIFVSRGLLDRIDMDELKVVLAHEYAHAQRRDNLTRLVIDWATRLWPTKQRRLLHNDFSSTAEYACDYVAAGSDRIGQLAGLIARLGDATKSVSVKKRIDALAEPDKQLLLFRLVPSLALVVFCLAQSWVYARAAHPVLEWLG